VAEKHEDEGDARVFHLFFFPKSPSSDGPEKTECYSVSRLLVPALGDIGAGSAIFEVPLRAEQGKIHVRGKGGEKAFPLG
jgi:hypothetical protein